MTRPTDELSRLMTGAADDIVERERIPGPEAPLLWRRGRRVTWAARAAAAGLLTVTLLLAAAVALVMRPAPASVPADGAPSTYPEFVSELFPGVYQGGPVFGLASGSGEQPIGAAVIDRSGLFSTLPSWSGPASGISLSPRGSGVALAPDGRSVYTPDGIIDLTDGALARPIVTDEVIRARTGGRGVWAPDSAHVLVDTGDGPAVLDRFADVTAAPGPGDRTIRLAGWRDATTVLGVRERSVGGRAQLEVVTRGLTDDSWTTVTRIAVGEIEGQVSPRSVHGSPDGSRLLLLYPASSGSGPAWAALVDARTGERVAFTGAAPEDARAWDRCTPVWQGDQPLTASGGLHRPGDGATVMGFSGRTDVGCVTLAGNELTGAPDPHSAGLLRERVWRVTLPVGGALALAGAVWMVLALRRSRRHGERFLPMIYVQRF